MKLTEQFEYLERQPYFKQWLKYLIMPPPSPQISPKRFLDEQIISMLDLFLWPYTYEGYEYWATKAKANAKELRLSESISRYRLKAEAIEYFSERYPEYFI